MFLVGVAVRDFLANNHAQTRSRQVAIIFQDRQAGRPRLGPRSFARNVRRTVAAPGGCHRPRADRAAECRSPFEVARELRLPLDMCSSCASSAFPVDEELAMGASRQRRRRRPPERGQSAPAGFPQETLDAVVAREQVGDCERREALRTATAVRPRPSRSARTAILVDDGLATGSTMRAAARALRPIARRSRRSRSRSRQLGTCEQLRRRSRPGWSAVETPEPFHSVGEFYRNFDQTTLTPRSAHLLAQACASISDDRRTGKLTAVTEFPCEKRGRDTTPDARCPPRLHRRLYRASPPRFIH
jgi:putative phosphoribosyl transferase